MPMTEEHVQGAHVGDDEAGRHHGGAHDGPQRKGQGQQPSMRLREVCRVYDTGIGVSNRRCDAEAACTISAVCTEVSTLPPLPRVTAYDYYLLGTALVSFIGAAPLNKHEQ